MPSPKCKRTNSRQKSLFHKYQSKNWYGQILSMNANFNKESTVRKEYHDMVSQYSITDGKRVNCIKSSQTIVRPGNQN